MQCPDVSFRMHHHQSGKVKRRWSVNELALTMKDGFSSFDCESLSAELFERRKREPYYLLLVEATIAVILTTSTNHQHITEISCLTDVGNGKCAFNYFFSLISSYCCSSWGKRLCSDRIVYALKLGGLLYILGFKLLTFVVRSLVLKRKYMLWMLCCRKFMAKGDNNTRLFWFWWIENF